MSKEGKTGREGLPDFVEYPKIGFLDEDRSILNKPVYVFEKVDGAQSQIRNTSQGLYGGSRSNYLTGKRLGTSWFGKFNKWMRSNKSLLALPQDFILFGEWLDPVTVDYDAKNLHKFYFFDLAQVKDGKPVFYDFEEAFDYLCAWGLEGVEVLPQIAKGRFTFEQIKNMRENTQSQLVNAPLEGLVLKNYPTQTFAKTLRDEYSDLREQEKKLEDKYINPVRVKKAVRRLIDEGRIQKPSFVQVVEEVLRDVNEEADIRFDYRAAQAVIRVRNLYPYHTKQGSNKVILAADKSFLDQRQAALGRISRRMVKELKTKLGRQRNDQRLALEVGKVIFPDQDFDTKEIIAILRRKKLI